MSTAQHNAARPPRFRVRWTVLGIDFLCLGLNYADRAAISVAAPFIINEFGFSKAVFGLILTAFFWGYAPFNFIGGYASDIFGPRKVMGIAVAWWSIFTALTAVGFNFISFWIIRFLFGFGEGPQAVVTAKTMSNWFPQREFGRSLGIANSATPLGGAVAAPIVAGILAATNNWRFAFIILGVVGLLVAIGWFVVVRDRPEQHPWISQEEIREIQAGQISRRPEEERASDGEPPSVWSYMREPLVIATGVAFFGYAYVLYVFLSWFPTFLVEVYKINLENLAIGGAIPWLAGFAGFLTGGFLTDFIAQKTGRPAATRKWIIVVCLLGTAALFAVTGGIASVWMAVALMAMVVFLLYITGAQYFAIIGDLVPSLRYGGVVGFVHFLANLAGLVAPFVTGLIVDRTGSWALTFGLAAVICALGAIVMAVFGNINRLRAKAEGRHPADATTGASGTAS
jgi:MFS transporter, ACS family, hexuronate transporter